MRAVYEKYKDKQEGSAMLITIIIITTLLIIVATTVNMSGRQVDLATLDRNTSNTYYLAKSAVEKEVEKMNEMMQTRLQQLVLDMNTPTAVGSPKNFIEQLVEIGKNSGSTYAHNIVYGTSGGKQVIKVKDDIIREYIVSGVKEEIMNKYGTTPVSVYSAQGDRAENEYETEVTIQVEEIVSSPADPKVGKFKITSTGTTRKPGSTDIYDQQVVEADVEISMPTEIINQIYERYEYADNAIPDILNNAITCYSDIIVGGSSQQQKLDVDGDVYVGGKPNIRAYSLSGVAGIHYPEHDQNGGVIVQSKGELNVTGNVFTTRNILATGGWEEADYNNSGQITIGEDAIAYTIGIIDDFYKDSENQSPFSSAYQVNGAKITINGNAMVDNDVMVDRWVRSSRIELPNGNIYGINGGADSDASAPAGHTDPNKSSGVFCQGPDSVIQAVKMFVAGQPYITLDEGANPMKLWESIGEPFDGIASFGGYLTNTDVESNAKYLLPDSPFYNMIQSDKIETDFDKTYAIAKVSGVDTSATGADANKIGADCQAVFGTQQGDAFAFFFQGASPHSFSETSNASSDYINAVQTIIDSIDTAYLGELEGTTKFIKGTAPTSNYRGLRGYMTVKRAALYEEFSGGVPTTITFNEVMQRDLNSISENDWTYKTPILVVKSTSPTEVDISDFYVEEGSGWESKPTIIVNTKGGDLTIKASDSTNKTFKGVIISKGPVKIEDGCIIEGSVIIGGKECSLDNSGGQNRAGIFQEVEKEDEPGVYDRINEALTIEGTVSITADPDIIFDVVCHDRELYRTILDMLGVTHYQEYSGEPVTSPQIFKITNMDNEDGNNHQFGKKIVNYTTESIMEVNTEGMKVVITGLKKRK